MIYWRFIEYKRQLMHLLFVCLPKCIQLKLRAKYETHKAQKEVKVFLSTKVSTSDVMAAFDKLHIDGDVKVHSSLMQIGNVQGKHKPFVQCLQEKVIDKGHTILAIAIPIKGSTLDYIRSIPTFSDDAPIAMGILSTYYASLPNAMRSLEPTHSVVAYGPKAEYYTSEHHIDETPFGMHSPYYKLLEQNGSVLMIGADIKHLTLCHLVEDLLGSDYPFPVYDKRTFHVDIIREDSCIWHGKYRAHSTWSGIMRVPEYVQSKILKLPSTQVVSLGASQIILINARDAIICELEELKKGNSIYGYRHINKQCKEKIDVVINHIKNL